MSKAYGIFRMNLIRRIRGEELTPTQVADALESEGLGTLCRDEIIRYRLWDDRWGGPIQPGTPWWNRATSTLEPWPHSAAMPPGSPGLPVSDSVPTPAPDRPSQGILERSDAWEILA
jgi:hypothetical protein